MRNGDSESGPDLKILPVRPDLAGEPLMRLNALLCMTATCRLWAMTGITEQPPAYKQPLSSLNELINVPVADDATAPLGQLAWTVGPS